MLISCAPSQSYVSVTKPLPPAPASVKAEIVRGLTPLPKDDGDAKRLSVALRRSEVRKDRALRDFYAYYEALEAEYKKGGQ